MVQGRIVHGATPGVPPSGSYILEAQIARHSSRFDPRVMAATTVQARCLASAGQAATPAIERSRTNQSAALYNVARINRPRRIPDSQVIVMRLFLAKSTIIILCSASSGLFGWLGGRAAS
ncbi:hypothetical protein BDW60DRAFT_53358 [Aspergillus nidulans var. acristatus]